MWEYDFCEQLVKDGLVCPSTRFVREQIASEYEYELERIKRNSRLTKSLKEQAKLTVEKRIKEWLNTPLFGQITSVDLATYRAPFLFFSLLAKENKENQK